MNRSLLVNRLYPYVLILLIVSLLACRSKVKEAPKENINQGRVTIWCDEAFAYAMNQQVQLYQHFYDNAVIDICYKPEVAIIRGLLQDSIRTVIIGRKLTDKEVAFLAEKDSLRPKQNVIGKDAVALLVAPQFPLSKITYPELLLAFQTNTDFHLVFDNQNSGMVQQLLKAAGSKAALPHLYALKNANDVIDYVEKDAKAIGFIGYGIIADEEHPYSQEVLKRVRILPIVVTDTAGKTYVTAASQGDLAANVYPLQRSINYVLCNNRERVADGFVNFLLRDEASKVFMKAGLVPTVIPERQITVSSDGLNARN